MLPNEPVALSAHGQASPAVRQDPSTQRIIATSNGALRAQRCALLLKRPASSNSCSLRFQVSSTSNAIKLQRSGCTEVVPVKAVTRFRTLGLSFLGARREEDAVRIKGMCTGEGEGGALRRVLMLTPSAAVQVLSIHASHYFMSAAYSMRLLLGCRQCDCNSCGKSSLSVHTKERKFSEAVSLEPSRRAFCQPKSPAENHPT